MSTFLPPVATLNCLLDTLTPKGSIGNETKAGKIQKIIDLGGDPSNLEAMVMLLSTQYQKDQHTIKNLRKRLKEAEDDLEEYIPTDFHIIGKTAYHFDYATQCIYDEFDHTVKRGKYHRDTGTYTMLREN